jgi:hypothetical protein
MTGFGPVWFLQERWTSNVASYWNETICIVGDKDNERFLYKQNWKVNVDVTMWGIEHVAGLWKQNLLVAYLLDTLLQR